MTPGIQPSNVKIRLRKKLAMRPVMRTATGGSTTQKKYRSAFISSSSSSKSPCSLPAFRIRPFAVRNLRSPDLTANRDKESAGAIQGLRFVPQHRSPCICRSLHCAPLAFPGAASHHGLRFLADRAPLPLASQSLWPSAPHGICRPASGQVQSVRNSVHPPRQLLQNQNLKRSIAAEHVYSYVAFIVSGEQKINSRISYSQITNAHLGKEGWQNWLRKRQC